MTIIFAILLLLGGTALLLWGADWFIDGVRDLARGFGISALVLAILLAGLEPEEMLVSAISSAQGAGRLALGDILGTNITILTLALGLSVVIAPIVVPPGIRRQALIVGASSLPALVLLVLGPIERLAGLALLLIFVGSTWFLWRTDRKATARMLFEEEEDEKTLKLKTAAPHHRRKLLLLTIGGLLAMAVGGPLIVSGALSLVHAIGLGQEVIGGTIVALGTGAEMLALGVSAARKGHSDILVGGLLGSFSYNLLVTMGLAALVNPLPSITTSVTLVPALWLMVGVFVVLLLCIWLGKIGRVFGWACLTLYVLYLSFMIVRGAMGTF